MRSGKSKGRSGTCYHRKVARTTKWHRDLVKAREKLPKTDPKTGAVYLRKELNPLSYYVDKIKRPTGEK